MKSMLSSTIRRRIGAMMSTTKTTTTTNMSRQYPSLSYSSLQVQLSPSGSNSSKSLSPLSPLSASASSSASSSLVKYFSSSEAAARQQNQTNDGNGNGNVNNGDGGSDGGSGGGEVKRSIRLIPTRHSRHYIPSIAPHDILDNATDKILNSIPGTLFAYETSYLNQSKREEYETGLSVSHYHQEHIEYILRGYSSLLPNNNKNNNNNSTIVHLQSKSETNIDVDSNMKEEEMERVVNKMIQLVERMEDEGRVYVDLRSKLRSQMAHVRRQERQAAASAAAAAADDADNTAASEKREGRASSNLISNSDSDSSSSSDSDDDGDDATEENREAWKMVQLVENYGAPPGPSAAMYDLTLDAIANVIHNTSDPIPYLQKSMELFERSLSRNELDRKQALDVVNLKSMPTAATFNAVIRISSNVVKESGSGSSNEQVRDVAVTNAFTAFHAMDVHPHVHRNSATYNYLVRTVDKFFPACKAKGHILATVWDDCVFKDAVLDENVIKAFLDVKYEDCGEDIHFYFTKRIADVYDPEVKNGYGFPVKYSRNKKKRRFDKALDVY